MNSGEYKASNPTGDFNTWQTNRARNASGQLTDPMYSGNTSVASTSIPAASVPAIPTAQSGGITFDPNYMTNQGNVSTGLATSSVLKPEVSTEGNSWNFFKGKEGGSDFANTAAGLGSLANVYFGYQGMKNAKDALNLQKEQYNYLKDREAKHDTAKAGLAERFK
jgi:hypothetical protein